MPGRFPKIAVNCQGCSLRDISRRARRAIRLGMWHPLKGKHPSRARLVAGELAVRLLDRFERRPYTMIAAFFAIGAAVGVAVAWAPSSGPRDTRSELSVSQQTSDDSSAPAVSNALSTANSPIAAPQEQTKMADMPAPKAAAAPTSPIRDEAVAVTPNQKVSTTVPSCESEPINSINSDGMEPALIQLFARRARLEAELGKAQQISRPPEFRGREDTELVMSAMQEEQRVFEARRQQIASELTKAQENVAQLEDQRNIAQAKKTIVERQAWMLHNQLDKVNHLLKRGISTVAQKLAIKQKVAQFELARLDMQLLVLKAQQEWMETEQHVSDLQVKMADWVEFNQTQQKLTKLSWRAFAMPHADFELQARERPQGPCTREPETVSNEVVSRRLNETSAIVVPPLPPADSHAEPKRSDIHGRQDDGRGAPVYPAAPATQVRSDAARSCKLAEARLAQLRAEPNREEVMRFARELECEKLRPQALRLLESLGVSLSAGEDFPRSVTPKRGVRDMVQATTPTRSREEL